MTCSSPLHQGDRVVREPGLERRIEFRRTTDQGREKTRTTGTVCKACMHAELGQPIGQQESFLAAYQSGEWLG